MLKFLKLIFSKMYKRLNKGLTCERKHFFFNKALKDHRREERFEKSNRKVSPNRLRSIQRLIYLIAFSFFSLI
jgi:hypothetical protein